MNGRWTRLLFVGLLLVSLVRAVPGEGFNPSLPFENATQYLELVSLTYSWGVAETGQTLQLQGTVSKPIVGVACQGPSPCLCGVYLELEFFCYFSPPLKSPYRLQLASPAGKGSYVLEVVPGKAVRVLTVEEQETTQTELVYFAFAVLTAIVAGFLLYFAYRKFTQRARETRDLEEEEKRLKEEMQALQIRFMKRELDADAYAKLYEQKQFAYEKVKRVLAERAKK